MRHWRWAVVIGGALALASLPILTSRWPVAEPSITAAELTTRVIASGSQPFEGLYQTRGGLRLPDLGRLDDEVAPLTTSTRVRVWYGAPDRWRADELLVGAERGVYRQPDGVWLWDSGTRRIVYSPRSGPEPLRIPRLMDLSPAELGRRLLNASESETIVSIDARRVAGHVGAGLRITPIAPQSTISSVELWADPDSGVVLEVRINTGGTAPAFEASFTKLDYRTPDDDVLQFDPAGVDEPVRQANAVDPIEQADQLGVLSFPDQLAGLPRRGDATGGIATYGTGLSVVNLAIVAESSLGRRIRSLPETERPWGGSATVLPTSLVNLQIVRLDGFAMVLSGTVTVAELDRIVGEIATGDLTGALFADAFGVGLDGGLDGDPGDGSQSG